MDSMKDEMNQADIAALHHFYSRHISDLPDDQALTELFAQVRTESEPMYSLHCKLMHGSLVASLGKRYTNIQLLSRTKNCWMLKGCH